MHTSTESGRAYNGTIKMKPSISHKSLREKKLKLNLVVVEWSVLCNANAFVHWFIKTDPEMPCEITSRGQTMPSGGKKLISYFSTHTHLHSRSGNEGDPRSRVEPDISRSNRGWLWTWWQCLLISATAAARWYLGELWMELATLEQMSVLTQIFFWVFGTFKVNVFVISL